MNGWAKSFSFRTPEVVLPVAPNPRSAMPDFVPLPRIFKYVLFLSGLTQAYGVKFRLPPRGFNPLWLYKNKGLKPLGGEIKSTAYLLHSVISGNASATMQPFPLINYLSLCNKDHCLGTDMVIILCLPLVRFLIYT